MKIARFLRKRLGNIGVKSRDAKLISDRVQYQLDSMGIEGTVLYLKRCGDCLIWALSGSGQKPAWVKTLHRYPVIFKEIADYPEEVILRVAKLARAIKLDAPTDRQVRKVRDAVLSPYNGTDRGVLLLEHMIVRQAMKLKSRGAQWQPTDYPQVGRQFRAVQSVSGSTGTVAEPPLWESLSIVKSLTWLRDLPDWEKVFHPLHPDEVRLAVSKVVEHGPAVGEIHAAQEGGAKLRMFASPYTVIQCLLSPMHYLFDAYRQQLDTDCTYDQLAGANWAQAQLRDGKVVHSVDLSTATCRFPLGPQVQMARSLGFPEEHIIALTAVSKGTWQVGRELIEPFGCETLSWNVGQPLGIKPSMSMFSLAHNLLLCDLCDQVGVEPGETFRVLGDDVVICNDDVARLYHTVVQDCGVPISWNKSHSSTTFAEFAGASITRDTLLRPGKWSTASSKNWKSLAIELQTHLGDEVTIWMRQAQKLILFREGLWDAPSENYSYWVAASTFLDDLTNSTFGFNTKAPFWYHKIKKIWERLWLESGLFRGSPIAFVYENPSAFDALQIPEVTSSEVQKQVFLHYDWAHNVPLIIMTWFAYAQADYEAGNLSLQEFEDLVERVENRAHSVLYLTPRSSGPRDHIVLDRCITALRAAHDACTTVRAA